MKKENSILFIGLASTLFASLLLGAFFLGARLGHRIFPEYSQAARPDFQSKGPLENNLAKKSKPMNRMEFSFFI